MSQQQTVLVTGATGLLGRQVVKAFQRAGWNAVGTGFSRANPPDILKVNLDCEDDVGKLLDEVKPAVLVHCAANRSPDSVDANPAAARKINVDASRLLAKAVSSRGIFLIYISTDYVFPGVPGEAPYEVDSQTAPANLYGQTKLDGETAVLEETAGTCLGVSLRVPVLYGEATDGKESAVNVLMDAVWRSQEKDADATPIKMDDWAIRYPTNTEDVGRVCVDIAKKYLLSTDAKDRPRLPRVLQFSSEDRYTKYEMCKVFADIMGLPLDGMVANKEGNDPNAKVQRPYDTHLGTGVLRDLGIDVSTQSFVAWWRREARAVRH